MLTPAVFRLEDAKALAHAAARLQLNRPVPIHLKIDTGMGRLGLPLAELESFADGVKRLPQVSWRACSVIWLLLKLWMTKAPAARSNASMRRCARLAAHGLHPPLRHLANSGAVGARPNTWHNFVRPGLALYGYEQHWSHSDGSLADRCSGVAAESRFSPGRRTSSDCATCLRVRRWDTAALTLPVRPARIAVVSVGYGDGLSRKVSIHAGIPPTSDDMDPALGRGEVLLRGQRAPMVGRISMDLTLVDVTHVPGAAIGDEVVLIGRSGDQRISAWDLARSSDTVVYETLCNLSKRVPRSHAE